MESLVIHHFLFTTEVVTPLELDEHSGSSLRGSFFEAVWRRFCTNKSAPTCAACPLHTMCPVSALVAPLREENTHGRDIPRPYIILPPLQGARRYEPGDTLSFGMTLVGDIVQLLPYIMLSIDGLEAGGLGLRVKDHQLRRGMFKVKMVESCNVLGSERQIVYEAGKPLVSVPTLAMTEAAVQAKAVTLPQDKITLNFLTPTRIRDQDHLVQYAEFRPLIHRLLDRFISLDAAYGSNTGKFVHERHHLVKLADDVVCSKDATYWQDVGSYSRRQQKVTPIGGLRGRATFTGDLTPFHELLVWGELMHVGKSCVKGNGWYSLEANM